MAVKGVDISEFNGGVNFDALKQAGVEFVIIRTGFGSDYPGQQDKNFGMYVTGCEQGNIPYGVYHYSYARDKQAGIAEAKHCLRVLNGRVPAYGVWFDMEDASTLGGDLPGAAKGFCDTIEAAWHQAGVYANAGWWKNRLTDPIFDRWPKWVAQYASECQIADPDIWQYTDKLVIGGQTFDGNWCYTTFGGGKVNKSRVFSEQENGITNPYAGSAHTGVDLGWHTDEHTPIIAHSDGQVVMVQTGYGQDMSLTGNASYGNMVKIKHPNGYYTLYAHLSQVDVKKGQQVKQGQKIGNMGETGRSEAPHLHFEVHNTADHYIDPTPYIAEDLPGAYTETPVDYQVEVTADDLNVRSGPGTGYAIQGVCTPGKHQIVAEADGTGASKWGKLSTGGWIALDYATKVEEAEDMTKDEVKKIALEAIQEYNADQAKKATPDWAKNAVDTVKAAKVMNGDDDGAFRPESAVKRDELAQTIVNFAESDMLADKVEEIVEDVLDNRE